MSRAARSAVFPTAGAAREVDASPCFEVASLLCASFAEAAEDPFVVVAFVVGVAGAAAFEGPVAFASVVEAVALDGELGATAEGDTLAAGGAAALALAIAETDGRAVVDALAVDAGDAAGAADGSDLVVVEAGAMSLFSAALCGTI